MSRVLAENAYTFRTVSDDQYLDRVKAEADPKANFLLVTDENKNTGERALALLVRKPITALGLVFPEKKLGPETLETWFKQASKETFEAGQGPDTNGFVTMGFYGDKDELADVKKGLEQDIRHLNNVLTGRMIQVTVESY